MPNDTKNMRTFDIYFMVFDKKKPILNIEKLSL